MPLLAPILKQALFFLAVIAILQPVETLKFLFRAIVRLLVWAGVASYAEDDDSAEVAATKHQLWRWRHQNIPLKFYGGGANREFDYYFSGQSRVRVNTVRDVLDWLMGCEYISDPVQFNKRDHWQHPVDFEKSRRGDCEDFALWAWRKLVELGHDAEFMVGKWIHDGRVGTHAWVFLRHEGAEYVFETTGRTVERMIKPYDDEADNYVPFASVDREMRKKVYHGLPYWVTTKM